MPTEPMPCPPGQGGGGVPSPSEIRTVSWVTLCDDNGAFLRRIVTDGSGAVLSEDDFEIDGSTPYAPVGDVRVCATEEPCDNPTTPLTTTGLCLSDGTPIAVVHTRDCDGIITQDGWVNLQTGTFSSGPPPAGAVSCAQPQQIQNSGILCDVDPNTNDVFNLVIVEYVYNPDGSIASTNLLDAATGDPYVLQGELRNCEAPPPLPEQDMEILCDVAGDGTSIPFVRDYTRDETGLVDGFNDYTLDGVSYTPTGTVGLCSEGGFDVETQVFCLLNIDNTIYERVVVEYIYDLTTGERVGIRLVNPLTGNEVPIPGGVRFALCEESHEVHNEIDINSLVLCDITDESPDGLTFTQFIRHFRVDNANGSVIDFFDTELDGSTEYTPQGEVDSCVHSGDPCRHTTTIMLCGSGDDESLPEPTDPQTTDTDPVAPSLVFVNSACSTNRTPYEGDADVLWNGGQITFDPGPDSPQCGRHYAVAAELQASAASCDDTEEVLVQTSVHVERLGPNAACGGNGVFALVNMRTNQVVAQANTPVNAPVGWSGTLALESLVHTDDLANGDIVVVINLETGQSNIGCGTRLGGWDINQFSWSPTFNVSSCPGGQFFRNVVTDCEGNVVEIVDTDLNGNQIDPVENAEDCQVHGGGELTPPPCGDVEVITLCDVVDSVQTPFLRHFHYNCAGSITGVRDTLLDGTDYDPEGDVVACGFDEESPGDQEPCGDTELTTLCDLVYDPQPPIAVSASDFDLTGSVQLGCNGGCLWFSNANQPVDGVAETTISGLLPDTVYEFYFNSGWLGDGSPNPATTDAIYLLEILDGVDVLASRTKNTSNGSTVFNGGVTEDLPPLAFVSPATGQVTIRFTDETTGDGITRDLLIVPLRLQTAVLQVISTPFVRRYLFNCSGDLNGFQDLTLDGDIYEPEGEVSLCSGTGDGNLVQPQCGDTELISMCDVIDDSPGESPGNLNVVRFLRKLTFDCNGIVSSIENLTADGNPYEIIGTEEICEGSLGTDTDECRNGTSVLLCDLPSGGTPDPVVTDTDPTPYQYDNGDQPLPGGAAVLWAGGSITIPPDAGPGPTNPAQNLRSFAAVIQAPQPSCDAGTAIISASIRVERTGPDDALGGNGIWDLLVSGTRVSFDRTVVDAPVGYITTLTVTATVPASEVAAGEIVVFGELETWHTPNAGGWVVDQFVSTVQFDQAGCETQIIRNIVTDCDGNVVSIEDTTLDGTPYQVTGDVGQCSPIGTPDEPDKCASTFTVCRCDLVDESPGNESPGDESPGVLGDVVPYNEVWCVPSDGGQPTLIWTYQDDPSVEYQPTNPIDCDSLGSPANQIVGVQALRLQLDPGQSFDISSEPLAQSVTVTAVSGDGEITDEVGVTTLFLGETATWSVVKDSDLFLAGPLIITATTGTLTVNITRVVTN